MYMSNKSNVSRELTRLDSRPEENTRIASIVVDGVVTRKLVKLEANLVAIDTAPSQDITIGGASDGVVPATINVCDLLMIKVGKLSRSKDDSIVLTSVRFDTDLTEVI